MGRFIRETDGICLPFRERDVRIMFGFRTAYCLSQTSQRRCNRNKVQHGATNENSILAMIVINFLPLKRVTAEC
jgi:hypothetical protein